MTDSVIALQPAFILQQRQFKESSLLLDVLTRDYGLIVVLAKGVRKSKSKTSGLLRPFQSLLLSCRGKSELLLLTHVELLDALQVLQGLPLYCAFYLNELILSFLRRFDAFPEVYADYAASLTLLASLDTPSKPSASGATAETLTVERVLRNFELNLMLHIGYAIPIQHEARAQQPIKSSSHYQFHPEQGFIEHPEGKLKGSVLQAIAARELYDVEVLQVAKQIMRSVIDFHLQGRPLKSRAVISKIYQQL